MITRGNFATLTEKLPVAATDFAGHVDIRCHIEKHRRRGIDPDIGGVSVRGDNGQRDRSQHSFETLPLILDGFEQVGCL